MFATAHENPDVLVRFRVTANELKRDNEAPRNPYRTGYGKRIPTAYRVRLWDSKWRRVYAACYSNVATTYIEYGGKRYIVELPQ